MISCFLLVPALVPGLVSLLVSLLVSSFFAQKRSLFHHEFLLLAGSGSGSGACLSSCFAPCLPEKGVCSIMISCFLLVPALVPGLVSLLVSLLVFSFFAQKRSLFHHDFLFLAGSGSGSGACLPSCLPSCLIMICCSSWFRLGFGCLSRFFSLLSFFRKGVLFHHDVLVPLGSCSGSGACLASYLFFLFPGNGGGVPP